MRYLRIGVGELVSFLYASGDLSSETFQNVSLLEGTKAHQYIQRNYQFNDQAEVTIEHEIKINDELLILSGRIDGLLVRDEKTILEEIKSTRQAIFDPQFTYKNEHLAQLKLYAWMYMKLHDLTEITGRIASIQISDYQMRYFNFTFYLTDLDAFVLEAVTDYLDWVHILQAHEEVKTESLRLLEFPFKVYRRGQREMMKAVYQTIKDEDILYAIAPTGIGKTMASLFSSLKSLTKPTQKIFYLTAKSAGKRIALDSIELLSNQGLKSKMLEITAKDSICFLEKRRCDPEFCPFAKGFFDRLKDATIDIFQNEQLMTRETIESYARKHTICPFEFSLYVSYFVDVIICDYNYVFDPRTHLIRYFDESTYQPIVLVDESHNMISRSRDMYTSSLKRSDIILLRRQATKLKPSIRTGVQKVLSAFDAYDTLLHDQSFMSFKTINIEFIESLKYLMKKIENALKESPSYPKKNEVIESYFSIFGFMKIYDYYNDAYLTNVTKDQDELSITLQCLDASQFIYQTVRDKIYGTVFFSATLYPIEYYQTLLTLKQGETLKIRSPFDRDRLNIVIAPYLSTRYHDRTGSIEGVVDIILSTIESKKGNYIAFFPSYAYLNQILERMPQTKYSLIIQEKEMNQIQRDQIVSLFKDDQEHSQIAFFVMGGMFAEGIDYIGDMLSGVIIVGVGLPMINETNNQLKDYYQDQFNKGFDYAYQYPGMNKVIQAVGRVIRTDEDYGVAILIDDRFKQIGYQKLFPIEWKDFSIVNSKKQLKENLNTFWNKFKK